MTQNNPQVPWSDEQWARANQVIQEEANRARVAATFLPLEGPLPPDTDFVRKDILATDQFQPAPQPQKQLSRITIDDQSTMKLATLQANVFLRGAQMADPNMSSALQLLRRAANVLARAEDSIVFRGQQAQNQGPPPSAVTGIAGLFEVRGGEGSYGLFGDPTLPKPDRKQVHISQVAVSGLPVWDLVPGVSDAISKLEAKGHFGPFAVALGQDFFLSVQTPTSSLVLPQDRILPFLGGGPLVRSSTLPPRSGVVVALGGAPVELVVATDLSLGFLQITTDPHYVFRLYEKIVLRIKQVDAIVRLVPAAQAARKP